MPNTLPGRISAFNYFGSSYHFQIQTQGLGEVVVTVPAWTCAIDPSVGSEVWLSWEPNASVTVRDS